MQQKIPEVESAKALMNEAMTWSVMKWLREKKRVRKTADQANAALDEMKKAVQEGWDENVRAAYEALRSNGDAGGNGRNKQSRPSVSGAAALAVKNIRESDNEAYRARMDAEETFDKAEKLLSTSLAREGCRKAILSWELHEKAIRKAEAVIRAK